MIKGRMINFMRILIKENKNNTLCNKGLKSLIIPAGELYTRSGGEQLTDRL